MLTFKTFLLTNIWAMRQGTFSPYFADLVREGIIKEIEKSKGTKEGIYSKPASEGEKGEMV